MYIYACYKPSSQESPSAAAAALCGIAPRNAEFYSTGVGFQKALKIPQKSALHLLHMVWGGYD